MKLERWVREDVLMQGVEHGVGALELADDGGVGGEGEADERVVPIRLLDPRPVISTYW